MKPSQYCVEYGQPTEEDEPPMDYRKERDFATMDAARAFFGRMTTENQAPVLFERVNMVDITPEGDPPGILWAWDREYLEES